MGTATEDITVRFFASLKDIFKQKEAGLSTDEAVDRP